MVKCACLIAAVMLFLGHADGQAAGVEARDEGKHLVLRNDRLVLKLDKERRGAIVSLVDPASGQEFVDDKGVGDLFLLMCSKVEDTSGRLENLLSGRATDVRYETKHQDQTAVATLTYGRIGGRDVTATCTATVAAGSDQVLWRIRVVGREPLILEEVHFPRVWLRGPLEAQGDDDAFVAGLTKGGVYHQPSRWKDGSSVAGQQPGGLCAQFGCYYSPRAGFYSATQDSKGYPKTLEFRRTKTGMRWTWQRRDFHRLTAEPFDLGYDIAMTTFVSMAPSEQTDWRDAADIYRTWALTQPWCKTPYARRADIPDWLKSAPAMVRFHRTWLGDPQRIESWLNDYWRKHVPDVPLIVALWGWENVDSWISPKYFPPYPSEEGFARIVGAIRRAGGHAFPWPSGYYWNVTYRKQADGSFARTDLADFEKIGLPHALLSRDGSPLKYQCRWLHGGENAILCRGDAWSRRWLNNTMIELAKRGCDMVQVDQVVGGAAPGGGKCYSSSHGHPQGPGLWDAEAFDEQLVTMAQECRRIEPNMVLSIEEPQELCNHRIGVQDYRDFEVRGRSSHAGYVPESIFGYLYHEFLPLFQSNPIGESKLCMAYCLATGQVPHVVPHWPLMPSPVVANTDFELWDADVPSSWDHLTEYQGKAWNGKPYRDSDVRHGGRSSLRLENRVDGDIVQVSQNAPVGDGSLRVGGTYRVRVWYKVDELAREDNHINLGALGAREGTKSWWHIPLKRSSEWTEGRVDVVIPPGAHCLRIMNHVEGRCRVWIDDLSIEEVSADGTTRPALTTGLPETHDLAMQWVKLFHGQGRPYLMLGRMLHPPKLLAPLTGDETHAPFPPILLNAFQAPDGSQAAVGINVTGRVQHVRFLWAGTPYDLDLPPWEPRLMIRSEQGK